MSRAGEYSGCGVVWCGVVWCGVVWCSVVWCGVVWCGVVWCGVVWCGVVWCGVVWFGVVWCGVVWYGVVWRCLVWRGVAWCDTPLPPESMSATAQPAPFEPCSHSLHDTPAKNWGRTCPQSPPLVSGSQSSSMVAKPHRGSHGMGTVSHDCSRL